MSQLTVIAKLKAKSGAEEKLYEECRKLIAPTLAEEGCINYDMLPLDRRLGLVYVLRELQPTALGAAYGISTPEGLPEQYRGDG